jgi:RimJ/RimL family protein N-acetyltransferase
MICINNGFHLDAFALRDDARLVEVINDFVVAKSTPIIPFSYTLINVQWWIQECELQKNCNEWQRNLAIRNADGLLCGGIGRHFKYEFHSHKDEIGYWLMHPLWGKDLMSEIDGKL